MCVREGEDISSPQVEVFPTYENFTSAAQIKAIVDLIEKDLSEPYSIYTYRCFIYQWPNLCKLVSLCSRAVDYSKLCDALLISNSLTLKAFVDRKLVGVIICKFIGSSKEKKGYIAMLAVSEKYRKMGIGTREVWRLLTINTF